MSDRTSSGELTSRIGIVGGRRLAGASDHAPRLVVLMGTEPGRRYPIESEAVVIGRSDECDLQLDDSKVSRRHARISRWEDGTWLLEDLGSRNGTLINGEPLSGVQALAYGDRIQLSGDTLLSFTRQDPLEDLLLHRQQMEVIGQLAAGIAHDFNNLLNVIAANLAHLDLLDPSVPLGDPAVAECRQDMVAAARRATELTDRLLKIARRREERMAVQDREVDVSQVCRDVLQLVRRTFDRSIVVDSAIEPDLAVDGDPAGLHQLLMNLCINARDAMPQGGVLRLVARREEHAPEGSPWGGGPHVVLEVKDTGVGMDEKTRARVFEPFFTTKEHGAGSGLGLATVYEVATAHGGIVEVDSRPGAGATFRVAIPALAPAEKRPRRKKRRMSTAEGLGRPRAAARVLVVDDQELVRRSLGRLLRASGHEVTYAGDGEEALSRFEGGGPRPDVVLMDLDMPKLSGADALRELRHRYGDVRVVLMSGYHDESRIRSLLEAGAADFLTKPVDAQKLRDAIDLAIRIPAVSF